MLFTLFSGFFTHKYYGLIFCFAKPLTTQCSATILQLKFVNLQLDCFVTFKPCCIEVGQPLLVSILYMSTGAFCLRVRDFEISYERIRWPAISRNQKNNGGLRGEKFRVRVVICVVYLPCLRCRRCQKIEKRLGCLWQKVTAKYFRIIRGNQVVLVWNSHVVSNLAKVA